MSLLCDHEKSNYKPRKFLLKMNRGRKGNFLCWTYVCKMDHQNGVSRKSCARLEKNANLLSYVLTMNKLGYISITQKGSIIQDTLLRNVLKKFCLKSPWNILTSLFCDFQGVMFDILYKGRTKAELQFNNTEAPGNLSKEFLHKIS